MLYRDWQFPLREVLIQIGILALFLAGVSSGWKASVRYGCATEAGWGVAVGALILEWLLVKDCLRRSGGEIWDKFWRD
jgi:hypothetical protein